MIFADDKRKAVLIMGLETPFADDKRKAVLIMGYRNTFLKRGKKGDLKRV